MRPEQCALLPCDARTHKLRVYRSNSIPCLGRAVDTREEPTHWSYWLVFLIPNILVLLITPECPRLLLL